MDLTDHDLVITKAAADRMREFYPAVQERRRLIGMAIALMNRGRCDRVGVDGRGEVFRSLAVCPMTGRAVEMEVVSGVGPDGRRLVMERSGKWVAFLTNFKTREVSGDEQG